VIGTNGVHRQVVGRVQFSLMVEDVQNQACSGTGGGSCSQSVGADGPNRRTVKRMCVSECIVVVIQSFFYLRIK
jgi:hypothetical protein